MYFVGVNCNFRAGLMKVIFTFHIIESSKVRAPVILINVMSATQIFAYTGCLCALADTVLANMYSLQTEIFLFISQIIVHKYQFKTSVINPKTSSFRLILQE